MFVFGIIVIILLIILLYNKDIFRRQYGEIISHTKDFISNSNKFNESKYKRLINIGLSEIQKNNNNEIFNDIIKPLNDKFGGNFDYVTHRILNLKIQHLYDLYGGTLLQNILQRNPDLEVLNNGLNLQSCIYDIQMEMLNSLVYNDDDPILSMPFINEDILKESIIERMEEIFAKRITGEETEYEEFKIVNEIIKQIKEEFEYEDQRLLNSIIKSIV